MASKINRVTVDLASFPSLIVIYLGMRVNSPKGLRTLLRFGPRIAKSVDEKPDGLLLHENIIYSLLPLHLGMRQYWRDFDSMEAWARSMPHRSWWQDYVRDTGGTGFWHETYFMNGGMEAIYDDIPVALGLSQFAPRRRAQGAMFSARKRAGVTGEARVPEPVAEQELGEP